MGFTDVIKKAFPFISIAASLGGPLGNMAAGVLGKSLGIDKPDASKIPDIIANAMATPEQRAQLLQAEHEFAAQMADLGYKDQESMESLAVQDRESARAREISVRDYTPEIGFYLLLLLFGFTIHWLMKWPIPTENRAIIFSAIGSLGTLVVTAATYFYGTTRGSETKSQAIISTASTLTSKLGNK